MLSYYPGFYSWLCIKNLANSDCLQIWFKILTITVRMQDILIWFGHWIKFPNICHLLIFHSSVSCKILNNSCSFRIFTWIYSLFYWKCKLKLPNFHVFLRKSWEKKIGLSMNVFFSFLLSTAQDKKTDPSIWF